MIQVLDHGYVNYIEHWGSDERIIEAARMSTNAGFKGWGKRCKKCHIEWNFYAGDVDGPVWTGCKDKTDHEWIEGDEKLLAYLWNHRHHTPFEMAGMTIEVQAPIMVFREWHRHRTQSYNEMSGRYTELPDMYYIPSFDRMLAGKQAKINKQSSEEGFSVDEAIRFQDTMRHVTKYSRDIYEEMLKAGVAREIARLILPVNQYSRMRASANLRNWLAFLSLRMATDAQWEIRQYANVVGDIINEHFPRTYQLFTQTRLGG